MIVTLTRQIQDHGQYRSVTRARISTPPSIVLNRKAHTKEKDMTTKAPISRHLTRYLAGPALALGLAIGSAAIANAVWDIGEYDNCIAGIPTIMTPAQYEMAEYECCNKSGGVWKHGLGRPGKCGAPGVDSQGRVPTHVMQPSPLPAPPGDIGPTPGGVVTAP
jgi:hypothetical protein